MSLAAQSGQDQWLRQAAPAGDARSVPGIWRRHRRRLLWLSTVALIALAASILTLLAASYQPLRPGGAGGGSFPGLRTGAGIRWVSQYIPGGPELYVPTQRGPFALAGSVVNRGSFAVTIVGVRQPPGSPFTAAGPVRYLTSAEWNLANFTHPPRYLLRDVTLAPGQGIMIGMPLRIEYCADRRSYAGGDVFLVTERFLGFTRTVPMPFVDYGRPVITNAPGGQPGPPGTFCSG
jgi:hypothetical protein